MSFLTRWLNVPLHVKPKRPGAMSKATAHCVLLADRHHRLMEGIRGLLETEFEVVVTVSDEISLRESVQRMEVTAAVVDFSLTRGDGLGLVRRLRNRFPELNLIVLSIHSEPNVSRATLDAGANGFVLKSCIATDLLPAIDAVLAGEQYVSPSAMLRRNSED
jgi:two-component system, NarL family, nitrate/nitrite response regulator NarL